MASPPFLPDETKPGDSDVVSQFPAVERTFRDIIETWLLVDHDTAGEHPQVTLPQRGSDPSNVSNTGFLYTKDDSGDAELFYEDDSGNVVQLTEDGALKVSGFPATTSMLFYQSAAPTGWTKDTNATLNKHGIQVVTSTAWAGGSNGATAFDTVFGSGKTAGGTSISVAQMPAHTHGVAGSVTGANGSGVRVPGSTTSITSESVGGGSSHNHTLSLDLNYVNVIRATKD